MRYKTPFSVDSGIIRDAAGEKVKLWGVNYYTPFNHNYYNIKELGKDHLRAIDDDLRHLRSMGVDLIRIHLYDREITDRHGNIVEGHQLQVFDYLVDQCEKHGIFLMLAPITWYNTIKNQLMQERSYAYWYTGSDEAFGFANHFSIDSMIWDPEAIACQRTYLRGLFGRASTVSGKRLSDHRNIVVMELFNEMPFPERWMLGGDPVATDANMGAAMFSRGPQRLRLVALWEAFRDSLPADVDDQDKFALFRAKTMGNYFAELVPIVRQHFAHDVLLAQYAPGNGTPLEELREVVQRSGFDAYSIGVYLNANGFDSDNTDKANHLTLAKEAFRGLDSADFGPCAKVSYEFDATASLNGYPLAALAAQFAKHDIQIAAYFTYTPSAVAAWNPGWLLHFMNLEHTPSRSAGFAAAGDIFRNHGPEDTFTMDENSWRSSRCSIERAGDLVYYKDETSYIYSNSHDLDLGATHTITRVIGRGRSRFASCTGNGVYALTRIDAKTWKIELHPTQRNVGEPGRGKAFRGMANRYVNCLKEPAVSILQEDMVVFHLLAFNVSAVRDADDGQPLPLGPDGAFHARPGSYLITLT